MNFSFGLTAQEEPPPDFESDSAGPAREERLRAGSLYEAFFANAQSLESGDVIIRVVDEIRSSTHADIVDGQLKLEKSDKELLSRNTQYFRLRFDHRAKRYLFASRFSRDHLLIEGDSIEEVEDRAELDAYRVSAFLSLPGFDCRTRRGQFPVGFVDEKKDDAAREDLFIEFGVPNLAAAGVCTFGGALKRQIVESAVSRAVSGDTISRIETVGPDRYRVFWDDKLQGGIPSRHYVTFDLVTIAPETRVIFLRSPSGRWIFVSKETYSWSENGGLRVPRQIVRDYQGQNSVNSQGWVGRGVARYDFHWFSVNEEFDDVAFAPDVIEDSTMLLRWLDPVASKATSLLDENGEESIEVTRGR